MFPSPSGLWGLFYAVCKHALYPTETKMGYIDETCTTDDPKVPIHLLIYAVQTAITTATCIADYLSWSDFSVEEKVGLGQLYGPYLALCEFFSPSTPSQYLLLYLLISPPAVFMGVDMYSRLASRVGGGGGQAGSGAKKRN